MQPSFDARAIDNWSSLRDVEICDDFCRPRVGTGTGLVACSWCVGVSYWDLSCFSRSMWTQKRHCTVVITSPTDRCTGWRPYSTACLSWNGVCRLMMTCKVQTRCEQDVQYREEQDQQGDREEQDQQADCQTIEKSRINRAIEKSRINWPIGECAHTHTQRDW